MSTVDQVRAIRRNREAVADAVIASGGNMTRFAEAIGLTPAGASKWLRGTSPDRLAALVRGRGRDELDPHVALCRLLLISSVAEIRGGRRRLARALGMTPAGLSIFESTWAPDSLEAAIADLMPWETAAAHPGTSKTTTTTAESLNV